MSASLAGIGTALPGPRIDQADAAELATRLCGIDDALARKLAVLYRRSGVATRHSVLLDQSNGSRATQSFFASARSDADHGPSTETRMLRYEAEAYPLAVEASRRALDESGFKATEITHLVTASCSGFHAPGFDLAMIDRLRIPSTVARTHVGFMGCHGGLNALRVAHAFTRAEPDSRVLLCAVELCSLHFQYGRESDRMVANALFADGAAAVVITAPPARCESSTDAWRLVANGSVIVPRSTDAMTWRIGDHGFVMTLSPGVPDLIKAHLADWLSAWLGRHGLNIGAVGSWAVHPGGPRILDAVADSLGLGADALADSRAVLAESGNMSSPTIFFILERLRRRSAPLPCVALAFGPGLAVEAALFADSP